MHKLRSTMKPQPFRIIRRKRKSLYDRKRQTAYFEETTTTLEINLVAWAVYIGRRVSDTFWAWVIPVPAFAG